MNSTFKNHAKIIKLAEEFDVMSLFEKYEKDISTGEAYFNFIKKHNVKNMESLFEILFYRELEAIELGDITHYNGKNLINLIDFVEDNFPEHYFYQKIDICDKKVIGRFEVNNIERGINRMDKNPHLNLPSYCSGVESDYATAIEIETIYEFIIPEVQLFKGKDNIVFVAEDHNLHKYYYISNRKYDERAYGTHYM